MAFHAAVIVFPGSNCDRDVGEALHSVSGKAPHYVWHGDSELPPGLDFIAIPGGFSYGDYLRSGAIAARAPIMREVKRAASRGVPVLGICNGFQVLTEAGMLPGTLLRNRDLKFICRAVTLKPANTHTLFTKGYTSSPVLTLPIAHHDGNYFADAATLQTLEDNGQIAFYYCDAQGHCTPKANPNGSQRHIAGIFNEKKNILGMMPHPERAIDPFTGSTDGRILFESLIREVA